jgi:hypothetical protein
MQQPDRQGGLIFPSATTRSAGFSVAASLRVPSGYRDALGGRRRTRQGIMELSELPAWAAGHVWNLSFYVAHALACGWVIWLGAKRFVPGERIQRIDPRSGELETIDAPNPDYSFARCSLMAALLSMFSFVAMAPVLLLPVPFGFGGFQFLYILAGIGIFFAGARFIVVWTIRLDRSWLAGAIIYVVVATGVWMLLAPAWRLFKPE